MMENDKTQNPALSKTAVSGSVILPTDLRIGNIVNLLSGEEDYYEIRSFDNEVMSFKGHISWDYIGYDEVKAIPLTEEWLEKFDWNGYNPLHFNSNFEIDKQGRLYCNGDYKGVNINYVHQLQNIYFALTGRELTER